MGRKIFASIVAVMFFYVASPLIFPVAMGAVIATLFNPGLDVLEKRKYSPKASSALLTLVITFFVMLPSSILLIVGVREAFQQIEALRGAQTAHPLEAGVGWADALASIPGVHHFLIRITHWIPVDLGILTETLQDLVRAGAAKLAELLGGVVTRLPGIAVGLGVIVVSVYFFLVDGRKLVHFFRRNSVFTAQQTDQLMVALAGTCRSVILASVVSGVVQASVEFLFCLPTGVPNTMLIALLVFLASFVPVIGAAPITFGVAFYQFFIDRNTVGVVLLCAAVLISVLDNLIRPLFLKGSANLHPLMAFVAAFGGLQTLGFSGVFLGPIIASVFVATVQILVKADHPPKAERPVL
ncbi:AI-2E family transporter [Bdellovibrionota bacterium FG-1]